MSKLLKHFTSGEATVLPSWITLDLLVRGKISLRAEWAGNLPWGAVFTFLYKEVDRVLERVSPTPMEEAAQEFLRKEETEGEWDSGAAMDLPARGMPPSVRRSLEDDEMRALSSKVLSLVNEWMCGNVIEGSVESRFRYLMLCGISRVAPHLSSEGEVDDLFTWDPDDAESPGKRLWKAGHRLRGRIRDGKALSAPAENPAYSLDGWQGRIFEKILGPNGPKFGDKAPAKGRERLKSKAEKLLEARWRLAVAIARARQTAINGDLSEARKLDWCAALRDERARSMPNSDVVRFYHPDNDEDYFMRVLEWTRFPTTRAGFHGRKDPLYSGVD